MASAARVLPLADPMDALLAAAEQAPLVELTDEERALLAEIEGRAVRWVPQEEFAAKLRAGDDPR